MPPKKRNLCARACVNCARSKTKCDGSRPCARCERLGFQNCVDVIPKRQRVELWQEVAQQLPQTQSASTAQLIANVGMPSIDFRSMFHRDLAVQMCMTLCRNSTPTPLEQGLMRVVLTGSLRYDVRNISEPNDVLDSQPLMNGVTLNPKIAEVFEEKLANEMVASSSIPTVRAAVSADGKVLSLLSNKANRHLLKLAKVFMMDHYHTWIHPDCICERAKYVAQAMSRKDRVAVFFGKHLSPLPTKHGGVRQYKVFTCTEVLQFEWEKSRLRAVTKLMFNVKWLDEVIAIRPHKESLAIVKGITACKLESELEDEVNPVAASVGTPSTSGGSSAATKLMPSFRETPIPPEAITALFRMEAAASHGIAALADTPSDNSTPVPAQLSSTPPAMPASLMAQAGGPATTIGAPTFHAATGPGVLVPHAFHATHVYAGPQAGPQGMVFTSAMSFGGGGGGFAPAPQLQMQQQQMQHHIALHGGATFAPPHGPGPIAQAPTTTPTSLAQPQAPLARQQLQQQGVSFGVPSAAPSVFQSRRPSSKGPENPCVLHSAPEPELAPFYDESTQHGGSSCLDASYLHPLNDMLSLDSRMSLPDLTLMDEPFDTPSMTAAAPFQASH